MQSTKSGGVGWLLVLGMALVGLAGMPADPPAADSEPARQAVETEKSQPSGGVPGITCEGDACWWSDLGRPAK